MFVLLRDSSVPIEIIVNVPESWWTVHGADVRLYTEEVFQVEPTRFRVEADQVQFAQVTLRPRGLAAPEIQRFYPVATPHSTWYFTTLIGQAPSLTRDSFNRILASLSSRRNSKVPHMHSHMHIHPQSATLSIISQLGG